MAAASRTGDSQRRVAVVHGYFLGESGSEIYARELARSFVRAGCEVTLVCQEPDPASIDFIDEAWELTDGDRRLTRTLQRDAVGPGTCRLVRPDVGGRLLVYAPGATFPGYRCTPMQESPLEEVESFVALNAEALATVFDRWPPGLVQANHLVLQPAECARALEGSTATLVTTFHGSELTFSLGAAPELVPFAGEGIAASTAVVSTSAWCRTRLTEFSKVSGVGLGERLVDIAPGVDTSVFRPRTDREAVLRELLPGVGDLDPEGDDILVYSGALRQTKGVQHVLVAFARLLKARPSARLVVVGDGPHADYMRALAGRLGRLDDSDLYARRVHFLGHLPHARLAPLLGVAELAFVPSVIPESFGLVIIEAAAAGAVPAACYHSGMTTPVDAVADHLGDEGLRSLSPGPRLSDRLADEAARVLQTYPTRSPGFREDLHRFADADFSWRRCAERYLDFGDAGA